ncbi:MAG: sigma 54-interacting transcriptional regulator [Alphaproteobacteria bacterium]
MATKPPQFIGESTQFHAILDRISDLAALDRPILIVGERGTGKELVASRLHFLSPRWEQAYIRVNCAAYTDEDLEIALFGESIHDGLFNEANGGTLFLDNIDAAALWMQERLLRFVETGEFEAVGSRDTRTVNIHVIAAASPTTDLRQVVKAGTFSAELLDRLASHVLTLPPLRIRPDDIQPLVTHFGKAIVSSLGAQRFPGITPEALAFLQTQPWPGNVRDLKNVIERSTAESFLVDESLLEPIHVMIMDPFQDTWSAHAPSQVGAPLRAPSTLPPEQGDPKTADLPSRVMTFERGLIDQALDRHEHHQGKAADYLGLSYHQFRGLLRKHGLKK